MVDMSRATPFLHFYFSSSALCSSCFLPRPFLFFLFRLSALLIFSTLCCNNVFVLSTNCCNDVSCFCYAICCARTSHQLFQYTLFTASFYCSEIVRSGAHNSSIQISGAAPFSCSDIVTLFAQVLRVLLFKFQVSVHTDISPNPQK